MDHELNRYDFFIKHVCQNCSKNLTWDASAFENFDYFMEDLIEAGPYNFIGTADQWSRIWLSISNPFGTNSPSKNFKTVINMNTDKRLDVLCNECGKVLFSTIETRPGVIGFEAQQHGFVYKNAVLFSDKYKSLYFCDISCTQSFYDKHIPKNEKVSQALKDMRYEIPEMAKDVCSKVGNLVDNLKKKGLI